MPVLEWATDLAASKAFFNASGVPISGLFAPLRTATPMPERARSTRLPATTLPRSTRSSIVSAVRMARSPPAPVSSSLTSPAADPQLIASFVPLERSKAGTRSSISVFTPLVQRTFIAAVLSRFPNLPPPSPAGLTTQVGFIRLAHLNLPKSGRPDFGWSIFFARRWIASELGLARVPHYQAPQVGQARLAVSSPAMTN